MIGLEDYVADNDPPCDGLDNDCNGRVDEGMADLEVQEQCRTKALFIKNAMTNI